jgi:hypothetical protein
MNETEKELGDPSNKVWTRAELLVWWGLSCRAFAAQVRCLSDSEDVTLVASTQEYQLSTLYGVWHAQLERTSTWYDDLWAVEPYPEE